MARFAGTTICVLGLGYVGLPTAAVLATHRLNVIGVDTNPSVVDGINARQIHIMEPELEALVASAVATNRLRATTEPEPAEAFIIAVPTPTTPGMGADLSLVEHAARSIAPVLRKGNLVILESTSPVGTTELIGKWLAEERKDLVIPTQESDAADVYLAHCPERVLPGTAISELIGNHRVVGGVTASSAEMAADLYRIFCRGEVIVTSARVAELTKLTENAFRDVNIAFANELARVCQVSEVNVWDVIRFANQHPRVNILKPGVGVGGHCIPVDPWFIIEAAPDVTPLMRAARQVNDSQPRSVVDRVHKAAGNRRGTVACLGLTYKENVDDVRNSPAIEIVKALAEGPFGSVLVVDPYVEELPRSLADIAKVQKRELEAAVQEADVVVLLVAHSEFRGLDRSLLKDKVVVDACGGWI
jgi:UDP-N-acetyl-D-mannosaminuronic acid dehydrogenase